MTYLVTGSCGFLGSYVVKQLVDEGEDVVGFDRTWPGSFDLVGGASVAAVPRITGDVADVAHMIRVVKDHDVDRIIHLAGELHARSADNPGQCIQSNIVGTHNVLELGRLLPLERIVTASSAAVFGHPSRHPPGPLANDAILHAGDVYEAAKIFSEREGEYYFKKFHVDNAACCGSVWPMGSAAGSAGPPASSRSSSRSPFAANPARSHGGVVAELDVHRRRRGCLRPGQQGQHHVDVRLQLAR